ncbi:MAG: SPASM domain-containing protein [Candidatus Bathyarchaeia archaeon]
MYSHPTYVNAHGKHIYEASFGDLNKESLEAIWNKTRYIAFRKVRENMVSRIPWCGDCAYSSLGCYYVKTNELDCQGNEHTCAECLYSANIAQCNI